MFKSLIFNGCTCLMNGLLLKEGHIDIVFR